MKKLVLSLVAVACATLLSSTAFAEKGKTITIKGTGKCAKCALNQSDTCQNVVEVKQKDKTVRYYLADNEASKALHEKICKQPAPVEVRGVCKKVGDKLVVTAESADVVKAAAKGKGRKKE